MKPSDYCLYCGHAIDVAPLLAAKDAEIERLVGLIHTELRQRTSREIELEAKIARLKSETGWKSERIKYLEAEVEQLKEHIANLEIENEKLAALGIDGIAKALKQR